MQIAKRFAEFGARMRPNTASELVFLAKFQYGNLSLSNRQNLDRVLSIDEKMVKRAHDPHASSFLNRCVQILKGTSMQLGIPVHNIATMWADVAKACLAKHGDEFPGDPADAASVK